VATSPLQHGVRALADAKESDFIKQLTEGLSKKEEPLIDASRLKRGQDWGVLGPQVVGGERG
jgi:hypothetical protein